MSILTAGGEFASDIDTGMALAENTCVHLWASVDSLVSKGLANLQMLESFLRKFIRRTAMISTLLVL